MADRAKRAGEKGTVVQIIGAVVDVEFAESEIPELYDALDVKGDGQSRRDLVLEVQQQIGGGVVRCIAMGSSDGLRRGLTAVNRGTGIKVPVGRETLGRIMNVLGEPVDEQGPITHKDEWAIHRAAPTYAEQSSTTEILETGIKVMDLICPFAKGGKVGKGKGDSSARYHVVKRGETLSSVARKYGTTAKALKKKNRIKGDRISVGQRIRVK